MSKAFASSIIESPIERVWPVIRDFGGLQVWLPVVKICQLDNQADPEFVGTYRSLVMADGSQIREKLLALSDVETTQVFEIVQSPLPVSRYVSTIKLVPVTDGHRTLITWTADYDAAGVDAGELRARFEQQVFQPGFDQLKQHFALQP